MAHETRTKAIKILIVEDQSIIAMDEAMRLRRRGYTVETVTSGEDALRRVISDSFPYDLVLMDIDLGRGMDGPTTAEQILARKKVPIIFLTGHSEPEVVARVRSITRYGYVLKSAGDFVLESAIQMALELFYSHQQAERDRDELRALYEHAPIGLLLVDETLQVRKSNHVWLQHGEVGPESRTDTRLRTIGEALECLRRLDDPRGCGYGPVCAFCRVRHTVRSTHETGVTYRDVEAEIPRSTNGKDLQSFYVQLSTSALELHGESLVLVSITDITLRKIAESELYESRERFLRLVETVPVMIWESDQSGMRTFFNERWLAYTGRLSEEEAGDGWLEGVHPDDRSGVREKWREALKRGDLFNLVYRLRDSENVYRTVHDSGVPRHDEKDNFTGFIGAAEFVPG